MFSSTHQHRYEHLRDIIKRHGGQSAVAEKLGVTRQYLNIVGAENAKKNIGNAMARKIETVFGLPINTIDQPLGVPLTEIDDHSVNVPLLNVAVSLGAASAKNWKHEAVQSIRLSKHWLRHNTEASNFETLAVLTAPDDSMAPTFASGAILLVDTSITQIKADAIYVLLNDSDMFIKRVQRNLDGSLAVLSDNSAYRPQVIENSAKAGLLVLGRVLVALNVNKL